VRSTNGSATPGDMGKSPFLSIVVPFHNSAEKCGPLLHSLSQLTPGDEVELILVDDGSTDTTPAILREFARTSTVGVRLLERTNGGPGAARNSALDMAKGRFIWFVDSDDDIVPAAVAVAKTFDLAGVDVIAWDYTDPETFCPIVPGMHSAGEKLAPPSIAQTFVAKWFAADFIRRNGIRFPEYCAYETAFELVVPLFVSCYLKIDFVAYRVVLDPQSVTRDRNGSDPRFYDRLENACIAMSYFRELNLGTDVRVHLEETFVNFCLWYNVRLTRTPGPMWLRTLRIMRRFRDEAARFDVRLDPFHLYNGRTRSSAVLRVLWAISKAMPPQDSYFKALRARAWGREISWDRPTAEPGGAPLMASSPASSAKH
jgi:glycosyltransferase involved in cell wall biosynthesis